ncbi:MAG: hypothetical protein IJG80_05435, partial [Selenomonadaceae bacterium]|nr:hypothetical protein [Selenomonadaceae bacterium]
MNIFILHPSFPAQYLNFAPYLASNPENTVYFLSKENSINAQLRNVTLALYPKPNEESDKWIKTCGPLRPAAEAVVAGVPALCGVVPCKVPSRHHRKVESCMLAVGHDHHGRFRRRVP